LWKPFYWFTRKYKDFRFWFEYFGRTSEHSLSIYELSFMFLHHLISKTHGQYMHRFLPSHFYIFLRYMNYILKNASNISSYTHSLWLVKIHMDPTKSCGSYILFVGPMWILTNQKKCVEKCVLEGVLLAFLLYLSSLHEYMVILTNSS